MVIDIAIGAGGMFRFQVRSNRTLANDSPSLGRFYGAVLPKCVAAEMRLATRYTLCFDAASII